MTRPFILYPRLIEDLIKELRISASELENDIEKKKGPDELLSDLERRHAIHSGLARRCARKLKTILKVGDD